MVLFGWFVIIDFVVRFRKLCWKATTYPDTAGEVKDPIFRWLSHVRTRCCCLRLRFGKAITDRAQGKFAKPPEHLKEPFRTERLLRHFFHLRRSNAVDTLDAYQFSLFPKSNGVRAVHICFDHGGMTVQTFIAVLAGAGRNIKKGSGLAICSMVAMASAQLLYALFCLLLFPSNDKGDSSMVGLSFALESVRTGLLLVQLQYPNAATDLQEASFRLSLTALAVPLVRFFYDAVIVHLITLHRGGKLNWKTVALQCVQLVATARTFALKFFGIDAGAGGNTGAAGAVNAAKAMNKGSQETLLVDITDAISAVVETVAEDVLAITQFNATEGVRNASTETRSTLGTHPYATHAYTLRHEESAKKVQAAFRARDTRCRVQTSGRAGRVVDVYATASSSQHSSSHNAIPGDSAAREAFHWLEKQETKIYTRGGRHG